MPTSEAHRAIDAVWRIESARIIAGLMRIVRDVGLAEELAQDALVAALEQVPAEGAPANSGAGVAALEQWPPEGVPDNPGAWLTTIAKRRAVDHIRRSERLDRTQQQLARD